MKYGTGQLQESVAQIADKGNLTSIMNKEKITDMDIGCAEILTSSEVVAGEYSCVKYRYTVGHPIDDTGYVKIAFRFAGDFGIPQFEDSEGANYCHVSTDGDCYLEPRWDVKGHTRPWDRCIFLKVMGGYLDRGDTVDVVFGDRSQGGPGWQMQTFCEGSFEFKTFVDPIATYQFKELKKSPVLRIVPGQAVRVFCIAPSQATVGKKFQYGVKEEDRWGNPVARPRFHEHKGFEKTGVNWIELEHPHGRVRSNPIEVMEASPKLGRYWGDLHGQSEETIGTNSIRDYFQFARDYALLDVAAHQGNDFQMGDDFWKYLNELTSEFNREGRFVTFPGYEWSGNTAIGGDRNVYYRKEGGPIIRSSLELVPGGKSAWKPAPTVKALFETMKEVERPDCFMFAHVGGRYADIRTHDEDLEWAVEVHSAWGTFEWMVQEAMEHGYRVGICGNSDGHKGRPGASWPGAGKFGSLGGLTCIRASDLSRDTLYEALKARHFYATTGNRSLLDVELYRGSEQVGMMGDIIRGGKHGYQLHVDVTGTGAIEYVEIFNGNHMLARLSPEAGGGYGKRFKIVWSGAERKGRARLVDWDGHLVIEENCIANYEPINFLNANKPLLQESKQRLSWKSTTTGGYSGLILELAERARGVLQVETLACSGRYELENDLPEPRGWDCGGVKKRMEIRPLPGNSGPHTMNIVFDINELVPGDNPIYVKVTQEDGHMAWSSPIYLNFSDIES